LDSCELTSAVRPQIDQKISKAPEANTERQKYSSQSLGLGRNSCQNTSIFPRYFEEGFITVFLYEMT